MRLSVPIASPLRATCLFFALAAPSSLIAGSWNRISTPNFDLYTSQRSSRGKDLLRSLENARSCRTVFPGQPLPQAKPVRVIAFRSESEFASYRLPGHASAYYLHAADE